MQPPSLNPTITPPSPLRPHLHLISCGHFEHLAGHYMHRKRTENYLLIWVTQGSGFVKSQHQTHIATAGDLILLDHGPEHEYGADKVDPWSILWVHFTGPASRSFFEAMRHSHRMNHKIASYLAHPTQRAALHDRFVEVVHTTKLAMPDRVMLQECLLAGLLGQIIHQLNTPALSETGIGPRRDVKTVLGYIDEHLHEPMSVDVLAKRCNVSVRQFNRLFTQQMGVAPLTYARQQRVNKASVLLGQTDLPVQAIAKTVGIDDAYYFSRLFRKETGVTPRAYRDEKRGKKS